MTREEAINRLRDMIIEMRTYCDESKRMSETDRQDMETFDMAIHALEQERNFIEELEKIKAEILKKVWRDAQGQIVTRDGFNHGIITATDIIDKHISELKGEQ